MAAELNMNLRMSERHVKNVERMLVGLPRSFKKVTRRAISGTQRFGKAEMKRQAMANSGINASSAKKRIQTGGKLVHTGEGWSGKITLLGKGRTPNLSSFKHNPRTVENQKGKKIAQRRKGISVQEYGRTKKMYRGVFVMPGKRSDGGKSRLIIVKRHRDGTKYANGNARVTSVFGARMIDILRGSKGLKRGADAMEKFLQKETIRLAKVELAEARKK